MGCQNKFYAKLRPPDILSLRHQQSKTPTHMLIKNYQQNFYTEISLTYDFIGKCFPAEVLGIESTCVTAMDKNSPNSFLKLVVIISS